MVRRFKLVGRSAKKSSGTIKSDCAQSVNDVHGAEDHVDGMRDLLEVHWRRCRPVTIRPLRKVNGCLHSFVMDVVSGRDAVKVNVKLQNQHN